MKISVYLLKESVPELVHADYNAKEMDVEFVDLTYPDTIHLEGAVEKFYDTLTFRGSLVGRTEHTCARCLKQVREALNHPFKLIYEIQGREEIDTLEDIREMLILDHSIRYLCRDNCAGLCSRCGEDLNVGPCSCDGKS